MRKLKWLCAITTAVCLSLGCAASLSALAEGSLTVGSLGASEGAASVEGTKDGKTKVSWTAYSAVYVPVSNYNNEDISVKLTPDADSKVGITLVNAIDPWNKLYELRLDADTTANTTLEVTAANIENAATTSANLFIYLDRNASVASKKTAVIEEIKVGNVNYTPTAYVEPEDPTERLLADYTDWTGSSNVRISANTITQSKPDAVVDGIGSVKFADLSAGTYTDANEAEHAKPVYVKMPITGVPTGWQNLYVKFKKSAGIENIQAYVNGVIDSDPVLNERGDGVYVCADIETAWNAALAPSSPEGYKLSAVKMGNYLDNCTNKHDLYLVINFKDTAVAADEFLDFGGVVWANETPAFATDEENLPVTIGDFENGDSASQYTIVNHPQAEGELPGGLVKVSYETSTARKFIKATVANVKKNMTRLVIDYYTTSGEPVNFGVYFDGSSVQGYKKFPAGDGVLDIDINGKVPAGAFSLRIYIDRAGQNDNAAANTVIIKSITFAEPLQVGEITQDASRFTIAKTDAGTEISWPEKVGTNYNVVIIPVTNWTQYDRFLKLTFIAEKDFVLGIYAGTSTVLSANTKYTAGLHSVYVDTKKTATAVPEGELGIYLYLDATDDSLANKMVLTGIEFVKEGVQAPPSAGDLVIDYTAETITFADTIEVFATKSEADGKVTYSDPVTSGSAVTPGAKLWFRTKAGDSQLASEIVEYTVPARPQLQALAPDTVTDSTIIFGGEGLSFKLGDGEWTTEGSFSELDPETEYTIRIKRNATATAFASEEITVKVTTKAKALPPDSENSTSSSAPGTSTEQAGCKGGCGSVISSGVLFAVLSLGGAALLCKAEKKKND